MPISEGKQTQKLLIPTGLAISAEHEKGGPARPRRRSRLLIGVLLVISGVLAVLVGRALTARSRQITVEPAAALGALDPNAAAQRLSAAIRVKTVNRDDAPADARAFGALHTLLAIHYPKVHDALDRVAVAQHSVVYTWKGSDPSLQPALFLAHTDVVPIAAPEKWRHDPFAGVIAEGFVWGRGAIDDKNGVLGLLEAVELLLGEGFAPKRTIMLAFGHDEETLGQGAQAIAARFEAQGQRFEVVLDEGGLITEGVVPGLRTPVAVVGIAEKGFANIRLVTHGEGGHASQPPRHTAVGRIARSIHRLEQQPFPMRIDGASAQMMDWLAPEMPFGQRLALRNRWLLDAAIRGIYRRKPSTAAALRTTTAATMLSGGPKANVLPGTATATVNFRLLPGDSVAEIADRVKRVIDDPTVAVEVLPGTSEPSRLSDPAAPAFETIMAAVRSVIPEAIVVPYLTLGMTDARHYMALSDHVYRLLPVRAGPADLPRMHGVNERVSVQHHAETIRIYVELIRRFGG